MEEEVFSLQLLLGLVDLVLFSLELADVVVVLVDLIEFCGRLDVPSEIKQAAINTSFLLLLALNLFFHLIYAVLLGLLVAVEVGAILRILFLGNQSLLEHLLELDEDQIFLLGDITLLRYHSHSMIQLSHEGFFL